MNFSMALGVVQCFERLGKMLILGLGEDSLILSQNGLMANSTMSGWSSFTHHSLGISRFRVEEAMDAEGVICIELGTAALAGVLAALLQTTLAQVEIIQERPFPSPVGRLRVMATHAQSLSDFERDLNQISGTILHELPINIHHGRIGMDLIREPVIAPPAIAFQLTRIIMQAMRARLGRLGANNLVQIEIGRGELQKQAGGGASLELTLALETPLLATQIKYGKVSEIGEATIAIQERIQIAVMGSHLMKALHHASILTGEMETIAAIMPQNVLVISSRINRSLENDVSASGIFTLYISCIESA